MIGLSIIVVTAGRDTLPRTLRSIQAQGLTPHDEVLVVGAGPTIRKIAQDFHCRFIEDGPFGCYGQRERQAAMAHAKGTHLLFMDDDDYYLDGAFFAIRSALEAAPDVPHMFQMLAPDGHRLWITPDVACGNVSGTQFVVPNDPERLGVWGLRREGDFDFIQSTLEKYPADVLAWHTIVIAGCRDQGVPADVTPRTRPMRILLVHPGASWSTADVYDGLLYGLRHCGAVVDQYRLDTRIPWSHKSLHAMWRMKSKTDPDLAKPNSADIMYHAGVGALEMALRNQVDVVIIVSCMLLHPDVLVMMKRAGLRVTVLFTESPYDHQKEMQVALRVDGCWTNERSVLPAFKAVNKHAGYLPHAWHPQKHYVSARSIGEVPSHDVVFVGSGFSERVSWFNSIDWTGIDLGLYGTWKNLGLNKQLKACVRGEQVSNEYAAALYRRAKIGLNLYRTSRGHAINGPRLIRPGESLSPRAYELAACGSFHLSDYRPEVAEVFGNLVPTFTTPTEAAALIRLWLADEPGRKATAARLPACVAESSWVVRAGTVLADLSRLLQPQAEAVA